MEGMVQAGPGYGAKALRSPASMNVSKARNGWLVTVHSPAGHDIWVAKGEAELMAILGTVAEEMEEQEHHV